MCSGLSFELLGKQCSCLVLLLYCIIVVSVLSGGSHNVGAGGGSHVHIGGTEMHRGNFNIVKVDISEFIFLLLKEIFVVLKMHPDKSMIGSLGSF